MAVETWPPYKYMLNLGNCYLLSEQFIPRHHHFSWEDFLFRIQENCYAFSISSENRSSAPYFPLDEADAKRGEAHEGDE